MTPTLFDKFAKDSIGFAVASDLESVPEEPGVYAWYLPLKGDASTDLLRFLSTLQSNVEFSIPATEISGSGRQRRFSIERNPPVFDLGSPAVQNLSESITPSRLQALANLVLVLSFFSEPIYVGMTEADKGLRSRLKQHLQSVNTFDEDSKWSGSFRTRIAKILNDGKFLKQCLIAYMPLPTSMLGEDSARVLEHILIRSVRPAQSVRG